MRNRITKLILFVFLVSGYIYVSGQERYETYIKFRVNRSTLDERLGDNAARLSEIVAYLQKADSDSVLRFVEISFCGSASPEGPLTLNRNLSEWRRKAFEDYLRGKVPFTLRDSIVTRCDGVVSDWELLTGLVENSDMPHKDEVIDVIRSVPELTYDSQGRPVESRKKRLMELHQGRTWKYMLRHFFPQMRYARLVLETVLPKAEIVEPVESEMTVMPFIDADSGVFAPPNFVPALDMKRRHGVIWAIKTNLLYDALTLPNLGVELRLDNRWTVSADWMYGWWNNNFSRHYFLRAYGGELSLRRWLGRRDVMKPFTGHHIGIYGQVFTYDFRKGNHGYMGGKPKGTLWDKMSYAVGAEYGYSVSLCRRLNLDMSLGVGYMSGIIHDYTPMDGCKVWQRTRIRRWFGPTKAEISLVYVIGKGGGYGR